MKEEEKDPTEVNPYDEDDQEKGVRATRDFDTNQSRKKPLDVTEVDEAKNSLAIDSGVQI